MQKFHSRRASFVVALLVSLCAVSFAGAQGVPKVTPPPFPTINVQNIKLIKQTGNVFIIAFDISAGKIIEPKIIYAVDLISKENGTLADQKIYTNDVVNIVPEKTIHKEITYTAPAYLGGLYQIKIETRNPSSLRLSEMIWETPVTLSGTNEQILIGEKDCFLSVSGEASDKKYTLAEGVDIAQAETLVIHCPLTNTFKTEQKITPVFQISQPSTFGGNIRTDKQVAVTLKTGKTEWSATLIKPTEPGVYDVSLFFAGVNDTSISSSVKLRYILRGEIGTVQNLIADKNSYLSGETAKVSFLWSGSANNFPGPRFGTTTPKAITATFTILDSEKNSCAKPFVKTLTFGTSNGAETISIPLSRNCQNPIISAKITNADGKVLSQDKTAKQTANKSNLGMIAVIISLIAIVFAGLIIYWKKK